MPAIPQGYVDELKTRIREQRVVVVAGAGVTAAASGGDPRSGWDGLLRHGLRWCEENDVELAGTRGLDRARADLDAGDLLSCADKLARALGGGGSLRSWLRAAFADLPLRDRSVVDALLDLGVPVATTNYDGLIEQASSRVPVTWRDPPGMQEVLQGKEPGIAHLHGYWREPDSVVLGMASYGRIVASAQAQALQRALAVTSSLLFVGCGGGLSDPNFVILRHFIHAVAAGSRFQHYRLVQHAEYLTAREEHRHEESIAVVSYGDAATDLAPFITSLRPHTGVAGRRRRAGQTGTDDLLNAPLLAGDFRLGPSLRMLWPETVLDPTVRPERHRRPAGRLSELLASRPHITRLLVTGQPGAGKSMVLRKRALDHPTEAVLVTAADLLDRLDLLDELGPTYELLVDGLDEIGADHAEAALEILSGWGGPLWVACRTDFVRRSPAAAAFGPHVDEVVQLLPWSREDVSWFVEGYATRIDDPDLVEWFSAQRQAAPQFESLMSSPLHLTLALYLASRRHDLENGLPTTRYALYETFYRHWVHHEVDRGTSDPRRAEEIRSAHVRLARTLYAERQEHGSVSVALPAYLSDHDVQISHLLDDTAFTGLLRLVATPAGERFLGFVHDTYGEFLLGQAVIASFETGGSALDTELALAFNDDVHSFVRSGLATKAVNERALYLRHLERRYLELRPEHTGRPDVPDVQRLREHLLYYIGRLDLPQCPAVLPSAYEQEEERVLRRAAALGATLHGDTDVESDYIRQLEHDDNEGRLNRAVQLVYFGDVMGDVHTAVDTGGPWVRTRQAIFRRLASDDRRCRRLRWWDLVTLRSFLTSRPRGKLSRQERKVLLALRHPASGDERDRQIAAVAEDLLRSNLVMPDDRSA